MDTELADPVITLKWSGREENMLEKDKTPDVTIMCKQNCYPLHKKVLSSCSMYFRKLFEFSEEKMYTLASVEPSDFEVLLRYIYMGTADVHQSSISSFLGAAESLKIKGLAVPDDSDSEEPGKLNKVSEKHPSRTKTKRERRQVRPTRRKVVEPKYSEVSDSDDDTGMAFNDSPPSVDVYEDPLMIDSPVPNNKPSSKVNQSFINSRQSEKTQNLPENTPQDPSPRSHPRKQDWRTKKLGKIFEGETESDEDFLGFTNARMPRRFHKKKFRLCDRRRKIVKQKVVKEVEPEDKEDHSSNREKDPLLIPEKPRKWYPNTIKGWREFLNVPNDDLDTVCSVLAQPKVEITYARDFTQEVSIKKESLVEVSEMDENSIEMSALIKEEWEDATVDNAERFGVIEKQNGTSKRRKQKLITLKPFQCFGCSEAFHTALELEQHGFCNGVSTRRQQLSSVESRDIRNIKSCPYIGQCPKCPQMIPSVPFFSKHFLEHVQFRCLFCSAVLSSFESLDWHIISNSLYEPYECRICDFSCEEQSVLVKHIKRHMKDQSVPCVMCSHVSNSRSNWKRHLRSHIKTQIVYM